MQWPAFNNGFEYVDTIREREAAGQSVLAYYTQRHAASGNQAMWQQRIQDGLVTVNGQPCEADTKLRPGDQLIYRRAPWQEPPAPCALPILFEDEHLVVVNKPSGLQVLPGGWVNQRTALTLLQQHHQDNRTARWPACQPPAPVHRLGRGTSGVLVCACTPVARTALSAAFAAATAGTTGQQDACKKLGKVYRALVQGHVASSQGCVETPIGKVPYAGVAGGLHAATPSGKPARSFWQLLERRTDGSSLLQVTIVTGRPHQIRIHMAAMGHPLVGDPLYVAGGVPQVPHDATGTAETEVSAAVPGDCGYWLHSFELAFTHPATGEQLTVRAPPPVQLMTAAEQLEAS